MRGCVAEPSCACEFDPVCLGCRDDTRISRAQTGEQVTRCGRGKTVAGLGTYVGFIHYDLADLKNYGSSESQQRCEN